MEGQQGGDSPKEVSEWQGMRGLEGTAPPLGEIGFGLSVFDTVLKHCGSLGDYGAALLWLLLNFDRLVETGKMSPVLALTLKGRLAEATAAHRPRGSTAAGLFPLPAPRGSTLHENAQRMTMVAFCCWVAEESKTREAWQMLSAAAVNQVAGMSRAIGRTAPTVLQERALSSIDSM